MLKYLVRSVCVIVSNDKYFSYFLQTEERRMKKVMRVPRNPVSMAMLNAIGSSE